MHTLEDLHLAARDLRAQAAKQDTELLRFQLEQLADTYEQVAGAQEAQGQRERLAARGLQDCLLDEPITQPTWSAVVP